MNWLVCNKCYKRMQNSKRYWSLTQCGHIYCNPCIGRMGNTCPQCETVDFSLVPLTNPPRIDTIINYFARLDDIVELTSRVISFQDNQRMIAVQAAQRMERKYAMIKEAIKKVKKNLAKVTAKCQKLQINIQNAQRARVSRSHSARRVPENNNAHSMDFKGRYEGQKPPFKPMSSKCSPFTNASFSSASSVSCRDSVRSSQKSSYKKPQKNNPNYPYNPNPLFSKPDYRSGEQSDSGCSMTTPSTGARVEGFLIPSISRVPKSAATAKRKTPTEARLTMSNPKSRYEF